MLKRRGTLLISKKLNLWFPEIKKYLEDFGFSDVSLTENDKYALIIEIKEKKPKCILIDSAFYHSATPYRVGELLKKFPSLNISAVTISEYPNDLAMYFIIYGAKSYLNIFDGPKEFNKGLTEVLNGREYVSPEVMKRLNLRSNIPLSFKNITRRQIEVARLSGNGFTRKEIADELYISERTVDTHKTELSTILNVRNERELIRMALFLKIISQDELIFYSRDFELKPKPEKTKNKEQRAMKDDKKSKRKKGDL
jgi:DNA-binding NarL/FixJ family response regulator